MSNTSTYKVTIRKQFPAHDERNGIVYEIEANNRLQAVRFARRQATDDGHIGIGQGRHSVSAEEITN